MAQRATTRMRPSAALVRGGLVAAALAAALGLLQGCGATSPRTPSQSTKRAVAPVAAAISADPDGRPARATMIMVHAGGWAGHDAHAQQLLMQSPGRQLRERGWRVVSIDYHEGQRGLQDVLDTAGAELARKTSNGPLCVYGESSGAHLALVAAARLRAIDCVIGLGAPTDLLRYEADATGREQRIVSAQISRFFGTTQAQVAAWDPVSLEIHARVLLMREGDDVVVPASQSARYAAAHPGTEIVELPAGDPADPSTHFVHGTISAQGRTEYNDVIGSFVDRALSAHRAAR